MFMSNYTNMRYEKNVSSVLMTVGKLFHRDAEATANEQPPALVRRYASLLTCY